MTGQDVFFGIGKRQSAAVQRRLVEIDQGHQRIDGVPDGDIRSGHDPRNGGRFLVHDRFSPHSAVSHVVAMVRGVENAGVVPQVIVLEGRQNPTDLVV